MSEEQRTLTSPSATTAGVYAESILADLVSRPLFANAYTVPLKGERTPITVPYLIPNYPVPYLTAQSASVTPNDPFFGRVTLTPQKATVATKMTNEYAADHVSGFTEAYRRAVSNQLSAFVEQAGVIQLAIDVSLRVTSAGATPTEGEMQEAMGLVNDAAWSDAAWYMNPKFWAMTVSGMDECHCCRPLPAGAIGSFKGFPVFPVVGMADSGASADVAYFGKMSSSLVLAYDVPEMRLFTEPYAVTDETLIVTKVHFGAGAIGATNALAAVSLP